MSLALDTVLHSHASYASFSLIPLNPVNKPNLKYQATQCMLHRYHFWAFIITQLQLRDRERESWHCGVSASGRGSVGAVWHVWIAQENSCRLFVQEQKYASLLCVHPIPSVTGSGPASAKPLAHLIAASHRNCGECFKTEEHL